MNSLSERIMRYKPSPAAIALVRQTKIVLLVGISGAGKDTIKKKLLAQPDFYDIVSHTTRLPRSNNTVTEINGTDYHFIDDNQASEMIAGREFIEVKAVHSTVYGTSVRELQLANDADKIAITDIDVQGVDEYKQLSRDIIAIFILPPSYDEWRQRLMKRYTSRSSFGAEWPKRKESAIKELIRALEVPYYHFIINDQLDHAVLVASEIAHKPDVFHRKDDEARLAARDLLLAINRSDAL